ncbi:hypothetical protein BLNAU_21135 [Blattamonas nauphoetae]|uniref:Uncharacterized protein n=1 Tax=Blattamonas nauphoetae TaxID=2049346 RepID=A0ABQ9WYX1_9EUKA|nr:hypothetical protein BLNAU_21135 [Blattamonas nauphoetae]
MTAIDMKTVTSSNATRSDLSSSDLPFSADCLPFQNWSEDRLDSIYQQAVVFRSLAATLKIHPSLDVSLEAKAVNFLESVVPEDTEPTDSFLSNFASVAGDSLTSFVQCIVVLIYSASQDITTAAMRMLNHLLLFCSTKTLLALVKGDLIPQLVITLNPLSLPFDNAVDIHNNLMTTVRNSLWLATPNGLARLEIEGDDEQQTVHETVLKQVLTPSEKYICHLCVNRFSIIDGTQSKYFLILLARLLLICPYYQPIMDFVLDLPVFLSIPSCLTFFEDIESNWYVFYFVVKAQREWNKERGEVRQMWKKVHRMLRMEGMDDVLLAKLRNNKNQTFDGWIVSYSIEWNNQLCKSQ